MKIINLPQAVFSVMAAAALLVSATSLQAQDDVVELGRRYGTAPPASYFETIARDPDAFSFSRAWLRRNPSLQVLGAERPDLERPEVRVRTGNGVFGSALRTGPAASAAASRAVDGTITFPMLLGTFGDDGTQPFSRQDVQNQFFDGPNANGTIPQFYSEISRGKLTLAGEAFIWARPTLSRAQVTGGVSGLGGGSRVGEYIFQLLASFDDGSVDWGRYDNDGPDGIPNSGDDDGFVDVLAVMHADWGGECGGSGSENRIWSHRWSLRSSTGQAYSSRTQSANGGPIRINDYTIQPVYTCGGGQINHIGVVAHELGHGLGLPDLYATSNGSSESHQGIGNWGLMGSGSWGCSDDTAARPCHMSAWSKAVMGWVDVQSIAPETARAMMTLPPVESTGRVWRVDIPGTREYYLLENRQRIGFDGNLRSPGLLVWKIDQEALDQFWRRNQVNSNPDFMGVRVIEADGQFDMGRSGGNRSDAGDPFPGERGATAFHAGTNPSALSREGRVSGLTIHSVQQVGTDISLDVETGLRTLRVRSEGTVSGGLIRVDGALAGLTADFRRAPFSSVSLEAMGGEETTPGVRRPFQSWGDGLATRARSVTMPDGDLEMVARYSGEEIRLEAVMNGGAFGVAPGVLTSTPASADLWFPRGTTVTVQAEATPGFAFDTWRGAFAGSPNPLTLSLDAPSTIEADFTLTYAVSELGGLQIAAGDDVALSFETGGGSSPFSWELIDGALPTGLTLAETGVVSGTASAVGSFQFGVRATDALGLLADLTVTLSIARPAFGLDVMGAEYLGKGALLTPGQLFWMDKQGNGNGRFDVGDIRRYLVNPGQLAAQETTGRVQAIIRIGPAGEGSR